MSKTSEWSRPVSAEEAARRAAGRRRYNARRTEEKLMRRREVVEMLLDNGHRWGSQAEMAHSLGVSESTISRDIKAIFERELLPCPCCRRVLSRDEWEDIARRGHVEVTNDGVRVRSQPPATTTATPGSLAALEYLREHGHVAPEEGQEAVPVTT